MNQKVAALDTLENVIKSKRHRAWTPTLELILKKFLGAAPCTSLSLRLFHIAVYLGYHFGGLEFAGQGKGGQGSEFAVSRLFCPGWHKTWRVTLLEVLERGWTRGGGGVNAVAQHLVDHSPDNWGSGFMDWG